MCVCVCVGGGSTEIVPPAANVKVVLLLMTPGDSGRVLNMH